MLSLSLRGYTVKLCPLEVWYIVAALAGGIFIIAYVVDRVVEGVVG